jgi:hypothetical protein
VVVAQGLHAEKGGPGEVADRQRAGHSNSLDPPLVGESTRRRPIDSPAAASLRVDWSATRSIRARE